MEIRETAVHRDHPEGRAGGISHGMDQNGILPLLGKGIDGIHFRGIDGKSRVIGMILDSLEAGMAVVAPDLFEGSFRKIGIYRHVTVEARIPVQKGEQLPIALLHVVLDRLGGGKEHSGDVISVQHGAQILHSLRLAAEGPFSPMSVHVNQRHWWRLLSQRKKCDGRFDPKFDPCFPEKDGYTPQCCGWAADNP